MYASNDDHRQSNSFSFNSQVENTTQSSLGTFRDGYPRGTHMEREIEALLPSKVESSRDYRGRIRTWPGVILLILIIGASGFFVPYFAISTRNARQDRVAAVQEHKLALNRIKGAKGLKGDDLLSDDGQIGNPKKYPASSCQLPNYLSKDGVLVAVATNGTEVPFKIKGVNWFGMETTHGIPFGLWENAMNGTTAYQIAQFLASNNFNFVRIPLMVQSILLNSKPDAALINRRENRAISVKNYVSLLQSLAEAFAFRKVGIVLSMHTLTATDLGGLWYNTDITAEEYLSAIDILAKNLCDNKYWNIIGIDLKNAPTDGTWGDGSATDFRVGAQQIGNRMLSKCPRWLAFVQGITQEHETVVGGLEMNFKDWWGAGLAGAKQDPVTLSIRDKVVYFPHYYSPGVYPQSFLYLNGTRDLETGTYSNFIELETADLAKRVTSTMDTMFGFLKSKTGPALILGEFGGLYTTDAHPLKTSKRTIDIVIDTISKPGYAGGFLWSLNGESKYDFNPADIKGQFSEGLLEEDWLTANTALIEALARMDKMAGLGMLPCFEVEKTA